MEIGNGLLRWSSVPVLVLERTLHGERYKSAAHRRGALIKGLRT